MQRAALPVLALILAGAAPQTPQEPPPPSKPSFPSQVELVTVDVAVVDKKGQSIRGLTRDDFVVAENGVPQTLTSFEAVVVPEASRAADVPRRTVVSTNIVPDNRRGRTFAVVFDDVHLSAM